MRVYDEIPLTSYLILKHLIPLLINYQFQASGIIHYPIDIIHQIIQL